MKKNDYKFSKGNIELSHLVYVAKVLLVFILYFLTAKAGLKLDAVSGFATLVWPPTGIALAALILFGHKLWPGVALAAFLVNFSTGAPFLVALGIALGNTLEALVGNYYLKKLGYKNNKKTLRNILLFITYGALFNTLIAATVGVSSLYLGGIVSKASYVPTWIAWWVGDALGALVIGNLILNFKRQQISRNKKPKIFEAITLYSILIFSNLVIFGNILHSVNTQSGNYVLAYLIFPILIWASLRFGPRGSAFAILITAIISIWATVLGQGPFAIGALSRNLLLLQGYIGIVAITGMILGAVIAERFNTEEELLGEKKKDEAILESIGDGVIVIDAHGIVLLVNQAAEKMLRRSPEDIVGHHYEKVVKMEDMQGMLLSEKKRPFHVAMESNEVVKNVCYLRRHDNTKFPVTITTAPILFEGNTVGAIDVFRDITAERAIDKTKSELVSLASHQLRTPLTTMKWYSNALLGETLGTLSDTQREYVKEMYHNNQRMIDLVNSLLNASRVELGTFLIKPAPCDIKIITNEIIHDLLPQSEAKNIKIRKDYEPGLPIINVDPNLYRIIVQNLLTNSIKYSSHNSAVDVNIQKKGEDVHIVVRDTGCGIPKDQQEKIFSKLFRADNARVIDPEGSGLGLYIVKSIIEQAGGKIWLQSDVHKGSTFFVSLPITGMIEKESKHQLIYT